VAAPFLSITTGTRNRPDSIERFARSVLKQTTVPFELLVADASDRVPPWSCGDPRVRVVREDPPVGPVRGSNALFRQARGEWVCFLNDDLEVTPGWGEAVAASIARCRRADLLCLPVLERGDEVPRILLYYGLPYACMGVVRRSAGEALGWYDEGYRFYATDPDFALRTIASGRWIAPVRGACVVHDRVADEERASHADALARDNARLHALWSPRFPALYRRYRRTSYRWFRDLRVSFSEVWNTDALEVPLDDSDRKARKRRSRRHTVDAPGWWWRVWS
jgi:GT2 family glycosyltransferase